MVPALGHAALFHSLGLLVIDEIQHLCRDEVKQSASRKLLSFIVQVVNSLGVPVVMVGNSNALNLLSSELRMARRSTGITNPHWMRFEATHPEWLLLTDELWKYQYLKVKSELTDPIRAEFYKQTQGIPDLAVKLFEKGAGRTCLMPPARRS